MTIEQDQFGDDLPKKNPWTEDRLGIAPYADRIARVIQKLQAPNGYVIGLHGPWGSGKSTVLNFVKAYLDRFNASADQGDSVTIVEFRPWIISGHQDLIAAFFKLLAESLGPRERWWKHRWRSVVRVFGYGSDKLIDAAAVLAVAALPPFGLASSAVGAATKRSLNQMIDRYLKEPSLQVAHQNLVDQLRQSRRRFLVIIDDLDRLEGAEFKEVMRMVKTLGHLPNIVYLLAYDKEIVWRTMHHDTGHGDPMFAEKIVQQELDLPRPSKAALLSMLSDRTAFIPPASEGSMRWYYIVQYGVHRWIKSPRDVERLGNSLTFSWPVLDGEVDPHDLFAMEGLKLFDPAAFNWIRDSRDLLFRRGTYQVAQDDERRSAVAALGDRLHESSRTHVLRVVAALFPQIAKLLGEKFAYSGEPHIEVRKRRGVGSEVGYESYFSLNPTRNAVQKADIERAIARLDDADFIENSIRAYLHRTNDQGEPLAGDFLDELRLRFIGPSPLLPTQDLLDALFRVGDEIVVLDWTGREFELPARARIWLLIERMLELWGTEESGKHLQDAFRKSKSTSFRADIYVSCSRALGHFDSDALDGALLREEDLYALGQQLLPAILEEAQAGTLERAPYYFDIIRAWSHLGDPGEVRRWISEGIMRTPEFLEKIGQGLLIHSLGGPKRHYRMESPPDSKLYNLAEILAAGRKHLAIGALSGDRLDVISELVRGAEHFLSDQSAHGVSRFDTHL